MRYRGVCGNISSPLPVSFFHCLLLWSTFHVRTLLERMVNRRLINHLDSNNVLSPTQTGYRKFKSTEYQLAYLAQNIEDAFQEKRKVLAVFFNLSHAFDKVWKDGLLVKLLRTGVHCKMYMWIPELPICKDCPSKTWWHSQQKSLPSWRSTTGRCSVPHAVPGLHHWHPYHYIKRVSNTLHADDLAIWNASEHTTTATYRIQEAIRGISKWTLDWGLEIHNSKTNNTLFSLSTSKEQIKLRLKDEIVPQTDTPTFLDPWCEGGHTTYLEATDWEDGEKWSAETSPDEKARMNYLGCRLINSDQSLQSHSTTNHRVCIHYVGNGC